MIFSCGSFYDLFLKNRVTPTIKTDIPMNINIRPFKLHSVLLYIKDSGGPIYDLLWRKNKIPREIINNEVIIKKYNFLI